MFFMIYMGRLLLIFLLLSAENLYTQYAMEWSYCYGGSNLEKPESIQAVSTGGSIVIGNTSSNDGDISDQAGNGDIWLVRLNDDGSILWEETYGGSGADLGRYVQETSDGGFVLIGMTTSTDGDVGISYGGGDVWVIKIDSNGVLQWEYSYGGTSADAGYDIAQTPDNGYIFVGVSSSSDGDLTINNGELDTWVVKIDASGVLSWQKSFGGSASDPLGPSSIWVLPNEEYAVLTRKASQDGDSECWLGAGDTWLLKLNSIGQIIWQRCIGGNGTEQSGDLTVTNDGGFLVASITQSDDLFNFHGLNDVLITKLSSSGNPEWERCFGGSSVDYVRRGLHQRPDGNILFVSDTESSDGDVEGQVNSADLWLVLLSEAGEILDQYKFGGAGSDYDFQLAYDEDGRLYVAGFAGYTSTDLPNHHGGSEFWVLKFTPDYNSVLGRVYFDLDSDFSQDAGEPALTHHLVSETTTGRLTFSNPSTGIYELTILSPGVFPISPASILHYQSTPASQEILFNDIAESQAGVDFAFQPIGLIQDLVLEITPLTPFRIGFEAQYRVIWTNVGTINTSPVLNFTYSDVLSFASASIPPSTTTSSSAGWVLPAISPFESGEMIITVDVDPSALSGEEIVGLVVMEPVDSDQVPSNNSASSEVLATASYDPNDITVDRDTLLHEELTTTDPLDYLIRFQNTGNDTAFNISVWNTFPTNVDRSSFQFVDASHDVVLDYDNETGTMKFRFYNIQLPDSNVNELASHGFVRYRIQPLSTLLVGDSILSQAAIYFDFNEPVITNTAYTVITTNIGMEEIGTANFQMAPNPTTGLLRLALLNGEGGTVSVYDPLGRQLYSGAFNGRATQLDLSAHAKGIYIVTLQTDQGISSQRLVLE
jgi:hypothetical protein